MKFNPQIHNKDYLISNPSVAVLLAESSIEFGESPLSHDIEILRVHDENGWSIAHLMVLSNIQQVWAKSDILKNIAVLSIKHRDNGSTVAHLLARLEKSWVFSEAAKLHEILTLTDDFKNTVAHVLARKNPEWAHSKESKNFELLKMKNYLNNTVAFELFNHETALEYSEFFHKSLLTDECKHDENVMQLAEFIGQKFSDKLNVPMMVMKLIEQGAAYKQSSVIAASVSSYILKKTKLLIEDTQENAISLKYAMALYSTCFHNIEKIKTTNDTGNSLVKWEQTLEQAEVLLREIVNQDKSICDQEHVADFNCEPSLILLNKIKAEHLLGKSFGIADQIDVSKDQSLNNQIY